MIAIVHRLEPAALFFLLLTAAFLWYTWWAPPKILDRLAGWGLIEPNDVLGPPSHGQFLVLGLVYLHPWIVFGLLVGL